MAWAWASVARGGLLGLVGAPASSAQRIAVRPCTRLSWISSAWRSRAGLAREDGGRGGGAGRSCDRLQERARAAAPGGDGADVARTSSIPASFRGSGRRRARATWSAIRVGSNPESTTMPSPGRPPAAPRAPRGRRRGASRGRAGRRRRPRRARPRRAPRRRPPRRRARRRRPSRKARSSAGAPARRRRGTRGSGRRARGAPPASSGSTASAGARGRERVALAGRAAQRGERLGRRVVLDTLRDDSRPSSARARARRSTNRRGLRLGVRGGRRSERSSLSASIGRPARRGATTASRRGDLASSAMPTPRP